MNGTENSDLIKFMRVMKDQLSIEEGIILLDARQIVIPKQAIKLILNRIYSSHSGINKSLQLAHSLFYWPATNNDIKNSVTSRPECVKKLPSQPSNPCVTLPPSSSFGPPMAKVSVDLFDHARKSHLVCVDPVSLCTKS